MKLFNRISRAFRKPPNQDLIMARAASFALQRAYHRARHNRKASAEIHRKWVVAKARVCVLEVRNGEA